MKRILGIVLILIVLAAFTPLGCFAVDLMCFWAADAIIGGDGTEYQLTSECFYNSITLTRGIKLDLNGKTLTVNSLKCADNAPLCSLEITGTGTLIINDSVEVTNGLTVTGGTVSVGTGTASGGITAGNGDIIVNGGTVTVTGGGISAKSGVTIEGGEVEATGPYGINAGGDITISGAQTQVTAKATATGTSGPFSEAGIYAAGNIEILGGTVKEASGEDYGIYAGGSVTITGNADVQNTALISGAAVNIEGSANLTTGIGSIFGRNSVVITGGTVTANGSNSAIYTTNNGAEISGCIVSGGSITISGAQTQVTAQVLSTASDDQTDRGIFADGNIEILGGTVKVTGNVGYGIHSEGRVIEIKGGNVTAKGNSDCIIANGSITISGGTVRATGGLYGINSVEFTISAGDVIAEGGNIGINVGKPYGGEDYDSIGAITIYGGTVEAIGSNFGINAETVIINKGTVTAKVTEYDPSSSQSGIFIGNIMTVNGGEVTATDGWYGIEGDVDINGGTVTAAGEYSALTDSVKNTIPGIGWDNTAGTGDGKFIGLPENPNTGQSLSDYHKVQFPAPYAAVTFTVVNGKWNDGTTEKQTVTLYSGQDGKWTLPDGKIPAAGSNPDTGFMEGSWSPVPSAGMQITENKTFTYTYEKKPAAVVTTAPTAQDLTYSGEAQELVTAGEASGGTMKYALGTDTEPTGGWSSSIPTGTGVETYYVWYKAVGDPDHNDSVPKCVQVRIKDESELPAPKFDPAPGSYDSAQTVTISCTEAGASIYYTTDGSEPTVSSTRYSGPIEVSESLTIKAVAVKENMKDSAVTIGTYTIKAEDTMELPAEISVVQGNGEKGVPEDVKAQTIRLTIRLKQNGELKLSSAPVELAVTPGGYVKPADDRTITFTPNVPDFKETCGNYEYEVTVTPDEVKADIAGAGDDGPAYILRAAAGSPDCEKFVITLYWNSKAAAPVPEVIRVVALPEDEIGAYQLRPDGTKEYLLFQTYDICMAYLGSDALCAGPERCYHK